MILSMISLVSLPALYDPFFEFKQFLCGLSVFVGYRLSGFYFMNGQCTCNDGISRGKNNKGMHQVKQKTVSYC